MISKQYWSTADYEKSILCYLQREDTISQPKLPFYAVPGLVHFTRFARAIARMCADRNYENHDVENQLKRRGAAQTRGKRFGKVYLLCLDPDEVSSVKVSTMQYFLDTFDSLTEAQAPDHIILFTATKLSSAAQKLFARSKYRNEVFLYKDAILNMSRFMDMPHYELLSKKEAREIVQEYCAYQVGSERRNALEGKNHPGPTDELGPAYTCTATSCYCHRFLSASCNLARYYNWRPTDMLRVTEPSTTTGFSVYYTQVVAENSIK